jgi:hypothetical protein
MGPATAVHQRSVTLVMQRRAGLRPRVSLWALFMIAVFLAAALLALPVSVFTTKAHAEQRCVLYIERQGQQLRVRIPVCFDAKGNVIIHGHEGIMTIPSRKFDACVPVITGVERVDTSTYLVRTFCKGYTPERETLVVQLIDDGDGGTLQITNAENS